VQVISSGVTQGISGLTTVYAVKSDGSLWAWGNNASGQIGNNSTTNQLTPLQVVSSGVSQVLSGYYMITYGYTTYIVKTDNSLWAWGNSAYSQSGNGTSANQLTPLQLLTNVSNGTYGYYTVEAVKSDGSLWAWGLNNYGTVGNNASSNQPTAVQIP
jgi:alpha-tubulin suppressor-like RCC1 family protein